MKLVGIGYKKGSGKDTFAKMLSVHFNQCVITGFADALKHQVADVCGIEIEEIEKNKPLFRPMLQWWGTDFRRIYGKDENYWIREMEYKYNIYKRNSDELMIISDVRFPNEAEFVRAKEGYLIEMIRNTDSNDKHSSETSLDNYTGWNRCIDNTRTLEDLEKIAASVAEVIKNR